MKKFIAIAYLLSSVVLLSNSAQAKPNEIHKLSARDPVSWSISPSSGIPVQTNVGSSYPVTYTLTNNLPFAVPLSVSASYNGGKFSTTNGCNTTLQPQTSCTIHLLFQPIKAGTSNATMTMAYNNNRVPLPTLSSSAQSQETGDRVNGHVSTPLPVPAYVGVTYPVKFTFVNNGNASVTATAVNVSGFTAAQNTCTATLASHATCFVSGNYTPNAVGQVTLGVTYVYNRGTVPLTTSTNAINGSGGCHHISADAALPLPVTSLIYANNVVEFVFTNHCPATTETINSISITSDNTGTPAPTIMQGTVQPLSPLTPCGSTLAPQASCAVFASVIPNTTYSSSNDLTVSAKLTYNSGNTVEALTSEAVLALTNDQNTHYFMLNNQCSENVWYGFNPGGTPANPTSNSTWQSYQLDQQVPGAAPATQILQMTQYNGGSMFGRTGCVTDPTQPNYGICNTANCTAANNSTGTCSYSPTPPFTIFEENLYTAASGTPDGVYDISMVNGFNLPGEIRSLSPYVPVTSTSNFSNTCGNSTGALIQPSDSALGACSWSFSPPSGAADCTAGTNTDNVSNYYAVSYGTANDGCTPSSCTGSNVCGMSQSINNSSVPVGTPIYRHCGTFQGYWTIADWVGFASNSDYGMSQSCNLYAHYSMGTTLGISTYGYSTSSPNSNPLNPATYADLYACKPTSQLSCYLNTGTNTCFNTPQDPYFALNTGYGNTYNVCGCHDWNNSSTTPANAQTAQSSQCTASNSLWENNVYNRILWLKQACPTAYSFQFDDKSSSFQCNVSGHLTSYQLTFCPGGKTGAPGT